MSSKINSLTATRAVAAIMVFIHHFGANVFPFRLFGNFFHNGNLAVSYFFVLSGFVLYISYNYNERKIQYADYMKRRIGRIVPVYLLALFLFLIIAFHFYGYTVSGNLTKQIIYSAFFLQAYIPQYALSLNIPAWTISVEMFFYILFPLLLMFQKKNIRFFVIITFMLFIFSQAIHLWYFMGRLKLSEPFQDFVYFNPLIHISQFLMGMIGGYLYNRIKTKVGKYGWLLALLLCIIVLLVAFKPVSVSYQVGLLAPLFMAFILFVAINDPRLLNIKALVFLGEISYGIYILQLPVYEFFNEMNKKYMHIPGTCFFYFTLAMLLLAATISYTFFETPLRKKINSISFKKRAT